MTILSPSQYVAQYGPDALKAQSVTGLDATTILAMAYQEGAYDTGTIAGGFAGAGKAFFGVKGGGGNSGVWTGASNEVINGRTVSQVSSFDLYDTFYNAAVALRNWLQINGYSKALADAGSPQAFLTDLKARGFATDPNWVAHVSSDAALLAPYMSGSQGNGSVASSGTTGQNPAQQIITQLINTPPTVTGSPVGSSGGSSGTGPIGATFADFFQSVSGPVVIMAALLFLIVGFLIWHSSSGGKVKLPNVIVANTKGGAAAGGGEEAVAAAAA